MKDLIDAELSYNSMKLRQLGAEVTTINSKVSYVKFLIRGQKIAYAYNINKDGKYFIEKTLPYPIPLKECEDEDDIVELIEVDLEQFESAAQSNNIESFIDISNQLFRVASKFEDLYLYYNVPKNQTEIISQKIQEIEDQIEQARDESERVYFKKDPDTLK